MVKYPYQGNDLFADPEYYHYAPCATPTFLSSWAAYTEQQLVTLPPPTPIPPKKTDASGSLHARLNILRDHPNPQELYPLVHRFEVFRRLWSAYLPTNRKTEDAVLASTEEYLLFAAVLIKHFRHDGNLQWVSTALKLADALLSTQSDLPVSEQAHLHHFVNELKTLVHELV